VALADTAGDSLSRTVIHIRELVSLACFSSLVAYGCRNHRTYSPLLVYRLPHTITGRRTWPHQLHCCLCMLVESYDVSLSLVICHALVGLVSTIPSISVDYTHCHLSLLCLYCVNMVQEVISSPYFWSSYSNSLVVRTSAELRLFASLRQPTYTLRHKVCHSLRYTTNTFRSRSGAFASRLRFHSASA
jgi:hypothetical protein